MEKLHFISNDHFFLAFSQDIYIYSYCYFCFTTAALQKVHIDLFDKFKTLWKVLLSNDQTYNTCTNTKEHCRQNLFRI